MKLKIKFIQKTLEGILIKHGFSKPESKTLMEEYLEGELQGKKSHGIAAFSSYLIKYEDQYAKRKATFKIVRETDSYVFVDARQTRGVITGREIADVLIKKAQRSGVALGLIKNMKSWLRPGSIAQCIARKKFVAIVTNTGGRPMMAPPGGYQPAIGTNPIGIGIPTKNEPLVVDMATSVRAWGTVRDALRDGSLLPDNAFLDSAGNVTKDPKKAFAAMPAGDVKGFALGLLIEVLCGSLVDMPMGQEMSRVFKESQYALSLRGGMILVINPSFSTSSSKFVKANSKLFDEIRKSKLRQGAKEILIPGNRANATRKRNVKAGFLEVDKSVWDEIQALA